MSDPLPPPRPVLPAAAPIPFTMPHPCPHLTIAREVTRKARGPGGATVEVHGILYLRVACLN